MVSDQIKKQKNKPKNKQNSILARRKRESEKERDREIGEREDRSQREDNPEKNFILNEKKII